jgi:hypothetical protein
VTANVYIYHSGQPGIPQLTAAGGAGQLDALLYAIGVTGFNAVTLDSLTQTDGVATATRAAGLNLADGGPALPSGAPAIPIIVSLAGSTNGWDGEYSLNAVPGSTTCTFACDSNLPSPATGTITLKRAPAGMTRLASSGNKAVYQFSDTLTLPGYFLLDDSNTQYAGVRLAETAANPVDYATMTGLCPTAVQQAAPGLYWRKTDGAGSNKSFVIVVWKGGLYVAIAWQNNNLNHETSYAGACLSRKAGDAFPGLVMGCITNPPSYPNQTNAFVNKSGGNQTGHYLQRSYPQTGSALQFTKTGTYFGTTLGDGTYTDPNPVDNNNDIWGPIAVSEGTSNSGPLRGTMPGLWDPVNCQNKSTLDVLTNLPALPGRQILLVRSSTGNAQRMIGLDITGPY